MMLDFSDVDTSIVENCRILHFGSVSLTGMNPSRSATLETVRLARSLGKTISYDPKLPPFAVGESG